MGTGEDEYRREWVQARVGNGEVGRWRGFIINNTSMYCSITFHKLIITYELHQIIPQVVRRDDQHSQVAERG